jgi:hypothetical protein
MEAQEAQARLRYLQLKKKKALAVPSREIPASDRPFMENVVEDAKRQGGNLLSLGKMGVMAPKAMMIDAPAQAIGSVVDMARGVPFSETKSGAGFSSAIETAAKLPGQAMSRIGELASNPKGAFLEKPITTTLDLAAAIPAVGFATRGAQAATRAMKGAASSIGRSPVGVRALETATGAPRAAIERRLARPDAVRNAIPAGATETPYAPLADDLAKAVNEVGDKARTGAAKAVENLSSSKYLNDRAVPKEDLVKIIAREKSRLRTQGATVGESKNAAAARLDKLKGQVSKIKGNLVSEKNIKDLVKSLDPDINWKATENAPTNLALERIRYGFDAKLKKGNPAYREAIAPVSRQMRVYKRSQRQFGLEKDGPGGFVPSDATASKLKSVGMGKVPMAERRLSQLEKETGRDFTNKARDIDAALKFEGGATQGSRRVVGFSDILGLIGTGAGASVAGVPGAMIGGAAGKGAGAILGLITDTNGRKMAANIIDNYLAVRPTATAQELVTANPKLRALIQYSMKDQTPQKALSTYLATRSIPSKDR